jgi:hypothetical protein
MMLSTAIKVLGNTIDMSTRPTPAKPMEVDGTGNLKETPIEIDQEMPDNTKQPEVDNQDEAKDNDSKPPAINITDLTEGRNCINNNEGTITTPLKSPPNHTSYTKKTSTITKTLIKQSNHGTNNSIKSPLRIIYTNINDKFNIIAHHSTFLEEIKKHDNSLVIFPVNTTLPPITDLTLLPTDEPTFHEHFNVYDNYANKCVVCMEIGLNISFTDLKYINTNNGRQDTALLTFMKANSIVAVVDKFNKQNTISTGFFLFSNPEIIFRDAFHDTILEILQLIDTNNPKIANLLSSCPNGNIPTFEITLGSFLYKNDKKKYWSSKSAFLPLPLPNVNCKPERVE